MRQTAVAILESIHFFGNCSHLHKDTTDLSVKYVMLYNFHEFNIVTQVLKIFVIFKAAITFFYPTNITHV